MLLISENKGTNFALHRWRNSEKVNKLIETFIRSFFFMQTTDIGCEGNLFLNKLVGSQIIVVPQLQYKSGLKQMMEKISEKL